MGAMQKVKVKICGITCPEDGVAASEAGADAIGLVFAEKSKRRVSLDQAKRIIDAVDPFVTNVGVFVDAPLSFVMETKESLGLDVVQLHGIEDEDYVSNVKGRVIKAVNPYNLPDIDSYRGAVLLVDQPGGGTGRRFDWDLVVPMAAKRKIILAGGLNADNVGEALDRVRPYAVDISSGVESEPGRKDHNEIRKFVARAKSKY